jgi:hypothetical protein
VSSVPWYGSRALVLSVVTSVALLTVTVVFWVYQAATLIADSSPSLVPTRIPAWVQPTASARLVL